MMKRIINRSRAPGIALMLVVALSIVVLSVSQAYPAAEVPDAVARQGPIVAVCDHMVLVSGELALVYGPSPPALQNMNVMEANQSESIEAASDNVSATGPPVVGVMNQSSSTMANMTGQLSVMHAKEIIPLDMYHARAHTRTVLRL